MVSMCRFGRVLLAVRRLLAGAGVSYTLAADAHAAGRALGAAGVGVGVLQLGHLLAIRCAAAVGVGSGMAGAVSLRHAGGSLWGSLSPSDVAAVPVSSGSLSSSGISSFDGLLPRPVMSGTTGVVAVCWSSTASTPPGGGSAGSISGCGWSPKSIIPLLPPGLS